MIQMTLRKFWLQVLSQESVVPPTPSSVAISSSRNRGIRQPDLPAAAHDRLMIAIILIFSHIIDLIRSEAGLPTFPDWQRTTS